MSWELASPNRDDWFAIFREGASTDLLPLRAVTGGSGAGSKSVTIPATVTQGTYQARLFAHTGLNRDEELARSATFTVIPPAEPVVTISPDEVRENEPFTLRYSGFPLGTVVQITEYFASQSTDLGSRTITSDPYLVSLVVRSGQANTQTPYQVTHQIISTVGSKRYSVQVVVKP